MPDIPAVIDQVHIPGFDHHDPHEHRKVALVVFLLVALPIGVFLIFQNTYLRSQAQDTTISLEPENGILFAPARVGNDPLASGGSYIELVATLTPSPQPPTPTSSIEPTPTVISPT